jgi:hypothetical protein
MLLRLRKPLRIVTGYVCACLVAGCLLAGVIVAKLPEATVREIVPGLFGATVAMARVAGIVGLIPSALVIAIFEWRAERRWLVHAAYGAVLAAAAALIISDVLANPRISDMAIVIGGSVLLGAASATVYWWIAGRFAGKGRSVSRSAVNGSA